MRRTLLAASALASLLPSVAPALTRAPQQSLRHDTIFVRGATLRLPRVACVLSMEEHKQTDDAKHSSKPPATASADADEPVLSVPPRVYFIMGGPGSGKGTQCEQLVDRFGMVHLSAGELLRAEVRSGSELGQEISRVIDQGQIVKSETTVRLLQQAMAGCSGPFLIDGFPRSISNLEAFESAVGQPAFMLFLDVSETEMEQRLLKRGLSSGRSDDNAETIVKRFRTFVTDSMPVVKILEGRGCLRRIDADASADVVFERVCNAFDDQGLNSVPESNGATEESQAAV